MNRGITALYDSTTLGTQYADGLQDPSATRSLPGHSHALTFVHEPSRSFPFYYFLLQAVVLALHGRHPLALREPPPFGPRPHTSSDSQPLTAKVAVSPTSLLAICRAATIAEDVLVYLVQLNTFVWWERF